MSTQTDGYKYNFVNEGGFSWEEPTPLNEETEEITLKAPSSDLYWDRSSSTINPLIFASSLQKTPNIKNLIIVQLEGAEALLLRPTVDLFKEHYPKNLTSVSVNTPYIELGNDHLKAEIDQLYSNLMSNLANPQLTSLTIDDKTIGSSSLNSEVFSKFFANSPNLRAIRIRLKNKIKKLTIPFNLCPNLERITISKCQGITKETFQSLRNCKKLHTLIFEDAWETKKLMKFLIDPHGLDLRVLDLGSTTLLSTDYELFMITKQLPNLEVFRQTHFVAHQNQITDEGLALLGSNCPKLTSFSFCFRRITDTGFTGFVQRVNNLQKLRTSQAYHLGENSLVELAKNCPQLKSLELVHWKEVTESGLLALAKNCPQLEHIEISCCKNVSLEGVEKFIQNAPRLKTIKVWLPDSSKDEDIKLLTKRYPHLNWHPSYKHEDSIPLDPPKSTNIEVTSSFSKKLLDKFLLESTRHARLEDIIRFVELGANPNMTGTVEATPFTPSYDENPLAIAARKGNLEIVRCLHKLGANFQAVEKIMGSLSQPKHLEALQYLLKSGCNPNVQGEYEMTPLQAMAAKKITGIKYVFGNEFSNISLECVKALVSHGADTSVLYQGRYSLADLAKRSDNKAVFEYFTQELRLQENQVSRPVRELGEEELIQEALNSLSNSQSILSGIGTSTPSIGDSMGRFLQVTMAMLSRDLGLQPIPTTDRLPPNLKNPVEDVISKPISEVIEKLLPNIKEKILGFAFTPELPPKRGIYYLEGKANDSVTGACYKRCMNILDDCVQELKQDGMNSVIQHTRIYDPMTQIIICTPSKEFFLIKNIDGFIRGKSTAERII